MVSGLKVITVGNNCVTLQFAHYITQFQRQRI